MSFPRYTEYKDSGVESVGPIPAAWTPTRLRFLLQDGYDGLKIGPFGSQLTSDMLVDGGPYKVYGQENVIANDFARGSRYIDEYKFKELSVYEVVKGDLLITMMGTSGRCDVVPCNSARGIMDSHLLRMRVTQTVRADFVRLLVDEAAYVGTQIDLSGKGSIMHGLNSTIVKNLLLLIPPKDEQDQLLTFLDCETAKIDELVAEQQRLMDLLKEKRQAVISHAVTRGLNPDAPMKPSGIEWLGDVPEHWEVTRLGWICSEINDINHVMPVAVEDGVPFLSAKDLFDDGTLNFTKDIKMISEEDFVNLSKKICPRRGDIIYSRIGACLGKARLVETDERFLISYSCCVVRVVDVKASRRFIQHLLDGDMILTEARMRTQGIGVPDLGLGEIGRFPVPLPPMSEQEQIAVYLDEQAHKFDTLTAEAQRAIDLLQERRTALISAAVTGQIDVRENTQREESS